jgi:hypothetical protein
MRSKMEYVLEVGKNGKQVPRKVGMAPVMRAGVEYEFTVVADMDFEHRLMITKSRCDAVSDQVAQAGRAGEIAETFKAWLASGEALADRGMVEKLVASFDVIANEGDRKKAKAEFVAEFGKPDQITAARYDDAAKWIDSYFSVIVPTKENGALL